MGWCHAGYSVEEARSWVLAQEAAAETGTAYEFAILGDGGRYLGGCGLNQINPLHCLANLGYWVRSSAMGQGVAPAAVRLAADYAWRETDLERLEIVCAVGNVRSQRVAEKAGAVREAVLRSRMQVPGGRSDAVIYCLLRPPQP
jgi:RimJ/RimL family protein N-acetyltransferase